MPVSTYRVCECVCCVCLYVCECVCVYVCVCVCRGSAANLLLGFYEGEGHVMNAGIPGKHPCRV